jgi:hypothetical protein
MVILKSLQEIEKIRKAGLVVADVLREIRQLVRPGISTLSLDEFAEQFIRAAGAKPAFKGYRGYPRTVCTSVNEQVIHGIPSKEVVLKTGDLLSIDVGALVDGFYGDAAVTVPVGAVRPEAERLMRVTEEALALGKQSLATVCSIFPRRSNAMLRRTVSRWSASSSATASEGVFTRTRRFPILVNAGVACGSKAAWCLPLNRWSTPGEARRSYRKTNGRR